VRHRCGRSLSPLSSRKTIVWPRRAAFFYLRPSHAHPAPDGGLVAFQCPARGSLAAPAEPPQDPPHVARRISHAARAFDQVGDPPGCPQRRVIPERFRSPLQTGADLRHVARRQPRLASGPPRMLQRRAAACGQSPRPSVHGLAVDANAPRDLRFRMPLLEEPGRLQSSPLHGFEIALEASGMSHPRDDITAREYCHYILRDSIITIEPPSRVVQRFASLA